MRLDLFLVADAASALEGKLFIHGGGITRITPPTFPWAQPLAFCVRLLVEDEDDLTVPARLTIRMNDPGGAPIVAAEFQVPIDGSKWIEGEERSAGIAVTASTIVFPRPGLYHIELSIDGDIVRTLRLPALLHESQAVAPPPGT